MSLEFVRRPRFLELKPMRGGVNCLAGSKKSENLETFKFKCVYRKTPNNPPGGIIVQPLSEGGLFEGGLIEGGLLFNPLRPTPNL